MLTRWCETENRDPATILRTVNLGFYLGADAKGAARAEQVFQRHFGGRSDGREQRTGYLRGTPNDVMGMVGAFHDLGCRRLNIALREGPYDWDALRAFAEQVLPAFGAKRPAR